MLHPGLAWLADGYKPVPATNESILPDPEDGFSLLIEEQNRPYSAVRATTPATLPNRRIKSAGHIRSSVLGPASRKENLSQRPKSARPPSRPDTKMGPRPIRRIKSADINRVKYTDNGFTLVNRMYDDEKAKYRISLHPPSDYRYMDRHSRCFDLPRAHTHTGGYLSRTARDGGMGDFCPTYRSPADTSSHANDDRPQTAPTTNKDVQRLRYNYVNRGQIPHFCNFVHKMHLYGRQSFTKDLGAGSGLHRDADDMDVTFDVPADPFSTRTERDDSGLMSRPSSPSSLDEKIQDDEDMENAIRDIVGRDSPNSDSDMILAEQLDKNSKSSVKIGAPVIDNRINVIRIPSPAPPVPKQVWSENKIPVNVPKSPVINKYVHDQKGQPSTPVAPPPPPPDNQKPRPASVNAAVRKRSRIAKKEKKPFERNRTTKTEEPEKVVQPPPEPTLVQEEESENSAEKTPYVPDFKVPDLPEFKPPEPVPPKPKPERQRQHSQIKYFKPDPREILDLEMKLQRNFFEMNIPTETAAEEPIKIEKKVQPWLPGRIALSKQSSRFELPMDMKILETMSPQEYLRRYCVITTRRQNLYHKMFQRHKEKTGLLLSKDLEKALKDVLTNTITANQISELSDMLEMDDKTKIDYRLFSGIAALAERILYPKYVTEDTADMPEHQREKIECADFCALDWKFHGVDVYPPVRKLLKAIG